MQPPRNTEHGHAAMHCPVTIIVCASAWIISWLWTSFSQPSSGLRGRDSTKPSINLKSAWAALPCQPASQPMFHLYLLIWVGTGIAYAHVSLKRPRRVLLQTKTDTGVVFNRRMDMGTRLIEEATEGIGISKLQTQTDSPLFELPIEKTEHAAHINLHKNKRTHKQNKKILEPAMMTMSCLGNSH